MEYHKSHLQAVTPSKHLQPVLPLQLGSVQSPQSPGQVEQVSLASQTPLPQHTPQSDSQPEQSSSAAQVPSPQTELRLGLPRRRRRRVDEEEKSMASPERRRHRPVKRFAAFDLNIVLLRMEWRGVP